MTYNDPVASEVDMSVMEDIARRIQQGSEGAPENGWKPLLQELFSERYYKDDWDENQVRDAYSLGNGNKKDSVPFAGFIAPSNPSSGAYGGLSLCWFPTPENGSLLAFVVGTSGLSPDEGILARPGHRRRIVALRRTLSATGARIWSKSDPSNIQEQVPDSVQRDSPAFDRVFKRYGSYLYCMTTLDGNTKNPLEILKAFFDLYASERGWSIKKEFQAEVNESKQRLYAEVFPPVSEEDVYQLLLQRRFVILQGPPGTGKTVFSKEIRERFFGDRGKTIQFHPAVTYEDFVVGLSPEPDSEGLHFQRREGWLLEAADEAKGAPYLLCIDEINRADLGKVLGEAIYLFEPDSARERTERIISLPHEVNGSKEFRLPKNLFVLGTMNTADHSIAPIDLAIRRRFAFVSLYPDRRVLELQNLEWATQVFDDLRQAFMEHVPDSALELLPGHAYFLANSDEEIQLRFKYQLLPLLDEYLQQGLVAQASSELQAIRDRLSDKVDTFDQRRLKP